MAERTDPEPARRRSGAWANLVLLGVSVAVALVAGELFLAWIGIAPTYDMHGFTLRLDADRLFRVRPRCQEEINSHGYRDREFTGAKEGRHRILVAGDSFVMGYNVPQDRTVSRAMERSLGGGYEVFNMGVYGYGPDQAYRALLEDGLELEPDTVLLVLFPANDFNDLYKNGLLELTGTGEVVWSEENPVSMELPASRIWMLLRKLATGSYIDADIERRLFESLFMDSFDLLTDRREPSAQRKVALMQLLLKRMRADLEGRGIRFGVVIVPSSEAIQDPERLVAQGVPPELHLANEKLLVEICRSVGVRSLDLSEPFLESKDEILYDPQDRHFSEKGNEKTAALIRDFLETP